jgi:hypothetical protein
MEIMETNERLEDAAKLEVIQDIETEIKSEFTTIRNIGWEVHNPDLGREMPLDVSIPNQDINYNFVTFRS